MGKLKNTIYDILVDIINGFRDSVIGFKEWYYIDKIIIERDTKKEEQRKLLALNQSVSISNSFSSDSLEEDSTEAFDLENTSDDGATEIYTSDDRAAERNNDCLCPLLVKVIGFLSFLYFNNSIDSLSYQVLFIFSPESAIGFNTASFVVYKFYSTCLSLINLLLIKVMTLMFQGEVADVVYHAKNSKNLPKQVRKILTDLYGSCIYLFITQIMVVGYHALMMHVFEDYWYLGKFLCLLPYSLYHSYYLHDYIWFYNDIDYSQRLQKIEEHWPYYFGFGLIPAFLELGPDAFLCPLIRHCSTIFLIISAMVSSTKPGTFQYKGPNLPVFHLQYCITHTYHDSFTSLLQSHIFGYDPISYKRGNLTYEDTTSTSYITSTPVRRSYNSTSAQYTPATHSSRNKGQGPSSSSRPPSSSRRQVQDGVLPF